MSGDVRLPDALRRALEADDRPVRPLARPAVRVAWLALWTALVLVAAVLVFGVRRDLPDLGFAVSWGGAVLECLAGLVIVLLALREAVPGSGTSVALRWSALFAGLAAQTAVSVLTWWRRGMVVSLFPPAGAQCFPMESTLALPALALTLFLVARAYAVRPRWAGLLGGAGAGFLTDGAWHLVCPHADLGHLLIWHGGSVLALAAFGWLVGVAVAAVRRRRLYSAR